MSFGVEIGNRRISLSETEMVRAWWETADLYDNDHSGAAAVTIGNEMIPLSEEQWQKLYADTSTHLDRVFWADILEDEMSTIQH